MAAAVSPGARPRAPKRFEKVNASLDQLAALAAEQARRRPGPTGTSPRLALGDIAENLEGTNCDSRLVARIDEALAAIP